MLCPKHSISRDFHNALYWSSFTSVCLVLLLFQETLIPNQKMLVLPLAHQVLSLFFFIFQFALNQISDESVILFSNPCHSLLCLANADVVLKLLHIMD